MKSAQNGSKNEQTAPRTSTGYPREGPLVVMWGRALADAGFHCGVEGLRVDARLAEALAELNAATLFETEHNPTLPLPLLVWG